MRLESGEPVADAQVRLFDLTDLRRFVGTTTDETGHFVLPLQAFSTDRGTALPTDFALGENYPNPFNPSTMKADGSVYGLTVSGEGLVAYVNPAFRVGVGEVDIVVEEHGGIPRMKRAAGGILGDVDGNGQVDVFDVLYVLLYSVDPSIVLPNNGDISRGDVNGDGMVEVADAVLLLRYLSNPSDPALPLGIGQDSDDTLAGATEVSLGSMDGDYRTWHLPDGAMARLGKGTIRDIAFSPVGQYLAVASSIGVWIYEVATSRALMLLPTASRVYSVSFSPDGATLASGSLDGTVRLWAVATGEPIAPLEGPTDRVYSVSFSPDGATLASGSLDGTVRLWAVATGEPIAPLEGPTDRVYSVSFSPDGATLASGSWDGTVRLWAVAEWTNSGTAVAANKLIGLPDELQLQQNAPNPFNSQTILSYFLPKSGMVRLELFSVTGQRVAVLRQGPQQAGYHRLAWEAQDDAGRPLASGIYFYRLKTTNGILTRKFTLLR